MNNNFIKEDIRNGLIYLQCGIMNAIHKLVSGEENEITLGEDIPFSLVIKCFKKLGFRVTENFEADGREPNCWMYFKKDNKEIVAEGNLYYGYSTRMWIKNETD